MPAPPDAYFFPAPVLLTRVNTSWHYLPLPEDVDAQLKALGVQRVVCELNGVEVRRGLMSMKGAGRYIALNQSLMRQMKAAPGDWVEVVLRPDPDPDHVDMAPEFTAALDADPEAKERFFDMTLGNRRSLASYITSAKRPETREKRSADLARKLRTYTLHSDIHPADR